MEPVYDIAQVLYPRNTQGRLPTLSPPFLTPDDAARFAHQLIGDKREVEYAGVILRNAQGRYLASRPVEMAGESFSPTQFISVDDKGQLKQPQGFRCYGFYYSRSHQLGGGETVPAKVSREQVITLANFFTGQCSQPVGYGPLCGCALLVRFQWLAAQGSSAAHRRC